MNAESPLRFAVDDILAPSWNRDQENQADALAVDLLIRSNMTIDSYANVFARLQKAFESEKASHDKRKQAADAIQASMSEAIKSFATSGTTASLTNLSSASKWNSEMPRHAPEPSICASTG